MIIDANRIPKCLVELNQWVNWKLIEKPGDKKPTKVPFTPDNHAASSTNPGTWNDFHRTLSVSPQFNGIGFVFSPEDPFCGIDFDHCRDIQTGKIADWAVKWIKKLNSYSEISPSATGVKVWVKAKNPMPRGKKTKLPQYQTGSEIPAIEVYDQGRYFAITGMRYDKLPHDPQERQLEIGELCAEFFKPELIENKIVSPLTTIDRARKYLEKIPGAISGSGGHDQTFKTACVLVLGFGLAQNDSLILLREYNEKCDPKWSDRELRHKIDDADKQTGDRGYLRDAKDSDLESIKVPKYVSSFHGTSEPEKQEIKTLSEVTVAYLEKIKKSGGETYVTTGIGSVDHAIGGGMEYGEMVIIAARPSHGKSAFGLHIMDASARQGIPAAIVSEEMSAMMLGKRTVQYASDIAEYQWQNKFEAVEAQVYRHFINRAPCYVLEKCKTSQRTVDAVIDLAANKGVKVVVVDYAQLLGNKGRSRYEEITQTSIALRQLANTSQVALVVLCQLNREITGRDKFIPRLEDLKDSGQLEQDADLVMSLVWPWYLDNNKPKHEYQVWVNKNRNRPIVSPMVQCKFDPSRQLFSVNNPDESNVIHRARWSGMND